MAFESLGENCEFGFVQRHFGAEPLGLLRFTGVTVDRLIDALDHDFEGVGRPDQTEVHVSEDGVEYYYIDTRYRFSSHASLLTSAATHSEATAIVERRGKFLTRKMLEDLQSAQKIFVYLSAADIAPEEMSALLRALRRHGPSKLLWVKPNCDPALHGAVMRLEDGLMVGYLDQTGFRAGVWAPSHALWMRILRGALKLSGGEYVARRGL